MTQTWGVEVGKVELYVTVALLYCVPLFIYDQNSMHIFWVTAALKTVAFYCFGLCVIVASASCWDEKHYISSNIQMLLIFVFNNI